MKSSDSMRSASAVVNELKDLLNSSLEDLQSYNLICDFMEENLNHARPIMTTLFIYKVGSTGKCNCLMCIDWLLNLAPYTIEIVNTEIVEYISDLLEDRPQCPGVLYSGTIMKLLPLWKDKLSDSVYQELSKVVYAKIKSGVEITNTQLLTTIIDQDRERFKRLKEVEWALPSDAELTEFERQPQVQPDLYRLFEKERDSYFQNVEI